VKKTSDRSLIDSKEIWLKEIPSHWEVKKIKWLTSIKRGASPRPIDDPKFFNEKGEYAWVRISDVTKSKMYLENTTQRMSEIGSKLSVKLNEGSLFLSIAGSVGKPCISKIKCCIHDGFVYFPEYKENIKFLYYIFESGEPYKGLGKLGTQLNLNTETVGSIKIGLPPIGEQDKITSFLDQKTTEIDELIADKEKLIKLLEEKRQVVITEAVTKGLDPNVKMKESGVEWTGEIPEHWERSKIKFISNKIIDGTHSTPTYVDKGIPFLRVTDLTKSKGGNIKLEDVKYISLAEHNQLKKRCQPKKGDLLVSKNGSIGIPKVIDWDYDFSIFVSLCLIKIKQNKVAVNFLAYFFESSLVNIQIAEGGKKSTITNLHLDKIKEFSLFLPKVNEQNEIVNYLNDKTKVLDNTILNISNQIYKLKEYRQSLIYEAVTGKIDVREIMNEIEQEEVSSS